ncbi:MAG: hypothetical protein PHO37_18555 [Kiritimatiellae bacterium]|nr:hypothetical protein [Kiritimatiellia bacterium]
MIDGFTEYYGAIAGNGRIALKCGSVCSKNGFEDAKKKLEEYLFEISLDAWSQFYDYSLYAQSDIGRENQVDNWKYEGSLVDGFYKTYNYRKPKPFTVKTPCPNSK